MWPLPPGFAAVKRPPVLARPSGGLRVGAGVVGGAVAPEGGLVRKRRVGKGKAIRKRGGGGAALSAAWVLRCSRQHNGAQGSALLPKNRAFHPKLAASKREIGLCECTRFLVTNPGSKSLQRDAWSWG